MPRVAIYARYSSDNQRDASIEDQVAVSRRYAERQGWTVVDWYADRAVSGASLLRPGIQSLMEDAGKGGFDALQDKVVGFSKPGQWPGSWADVANADRWVLRICARCSQDRRGGDCRGQPA